MVSPDPRDVDASIEFVLEYLPQAERRTLSNSASRMAIKYLVAIGSLRIAQEAELSEGDKQQRWQEALSTLATRLRYQAPTLRKQLEKGKWFEEYTITDEPRLEQALRITGICPLWPFCT